jgi:predicted alpha-1,2-mannosidase
VEDLTALVEPRLGTKQTRWIAFSAACRPFGMVNPAPDTRLGGDWGCGYRLDSNVVEGISHLHEWQIGALLVMPVSGPLASLEGTSSWLSTFDRATEIAKPGYHAFHLDRGEIDVELTATSRVALHRYRFHRESERQIVVDLATQLGPCEMGVASIERRDARTLVGHVVNLPTIRRPMPLTVYFAIRVDADFTLEHASGRSDRLEATGIRGAMRFADGLRSIEMRVGISYTSVDAAIDNLHREASTKSFDAIREEARREWNEMLSRVQVSGGDESARPRFYTDLFFALLGRRTMNDACGTYVDNTGTSPRVRQIPIDPATGVPAYRHFNSDAFWGAQWSLVPLWSIAYPELVREFCLCFLDMRRNGGLIPRGPSGGRDTFVMTSAQTTPLFVHAIHAGLLPRDIVDEVYAALVDNHSPGGLMSKAGYEHHTSIGGGIDDYIRLGYIPEDLPRAGFHVNGAAQTLEHAFNDGALAHLAASLGRHDDAARFRARSKHYRNLFDPSIGFMRPRNRDGSWIDPYNPWDKRGWTEANGWNYSFYAAHDPQGLIDCYGGAERFVAALERCFVEAERTGFVAPHDKHELSALDFGNEPPLATPFLFAAAGRRDLTELWLGKVLRACKSGNAPTDGYGGDEDQGIMGAWNVLARLGVFALDGACDRDATFQLHRPAFSEVTIYPLGTSGPTGLRIRSFRHANAESADALAISRVGLMP